MFRSEIRAIVASLSGPGMTFLKVDFVVATIVSPDLKNAFDIRLLYRVTIKPIFFCKQNDKIPFGLKSKQLGSHQSKR